MSVVSNAHGSRRRVGVFFIAEPMDDHARRPAGSVGRRDAVGGEPFGDAVFRVKQLGEFVEDAVDDGDLGRITLHQRDTLVVDALVLARLQDSHRFTFLVQQQAIHAVGRDTARPIALLGDLHAAPPDLVAQLLAVLGGPKTLELDIDRLECVILLGQAHDRIDHLLAMPFAF